MKRNFGVPQFKELEFMILPLVLVLLWLSNFGSLVLAQGSNDIYYMKNDAPNGVPYGIWITKFWDWWNNVSNDVWSKLANYKCLLHDDGKTVYLVDGLTISNPVSYFCNIPANRSIFIPLVNTEYDRGLNETRNMSDDEMRNKAIEDNDRASFKISVDGQNIPVEVLEALRATSPFWDIRANPDSHFVQPGYVPGSWKAISDGYFLFLKPLKPGTHHISYSGSSFLGGNGDVTYTIYVNSSLQRAAPVVSG
jgi:hypothetical protein